MKLSRTQIERHREYREAFPQPVVGRRQCNKCGEWKIYNLEDPFLSDFAITKRRLKGGDYSLYAKSYCRPCEVERVREYEKRVNRKKHGKRGRPRQPLEEVRLSTGPFQDWFNKEIRPLLASEKEINQARSEVKLNGMGSAGLEGLLTASLIADWVDVDRKSLPNYLTGKSKTIPRELVDKIGIIFGHMDLSDELYPETEANTSAEPS